MQMLYDSESFIVVHMNADAEVADGARPELPVLSRHGFEIVDKRSNKGVYLEGQWAETFQRQINTWQQNTPTQEEVEEALEGYAGLAQQSVLMH